MANTINPLSDLDQYIRRLNHYLQEHYPANKKISAEEWNALFLALMHQGNLQEETLEKICNGYLPLQINKINELAGLANNHEARISVLRSDTDLVLQQYRNTLSIAEEAKAISESAKDVADESLVFAKNAFSSSEEAVHTATEAADTAIRALNDSESAVATSQNALETAQTAEEQSSAAVDTSNNALEISENALAIVNTAEDNSATALATSQQANANSLAAVNTATTANTTSLEARQYARDALDLVTEGMGSQVLVNGLAVPTFNADTKADVTYVNQKIDDIMGPGSTEAIDTILELAEAFKNNSDIIKTLNEAVSTKANTSDVTAGLATKANVEDVTAMLATKADTSALDALTETVATKANTSDLANYISQGGTLTAPLKVTGGDTATAGKIILNQNNKGQITDTGSSTLFGFNTTGQLDIGHSSYNLRLRGKEARFKYQNKDVAFTSDLNSYLPKSGGDVSGDINFTNSSAWCLPYLLAFKNADTSQSPTHPYTGFYQWGNEWQVNARDANNKWAKNLMTINLDTAVATFATRPTVNASPIALQSDLENYVTTDTTQTISGAKTFSSSTTKVNARIEFTSSTNPGIKMGTSDKNFYIQSSGGMLGIGPYWANSTKWDSSGNVVFNKNVTINNWTMAQDSSGNLVFSYI